MWFDREWKGGMGWEKRKDGRKEGEKRGERKEKGQRKGGMTKI